MRALPRPIVRDTPKLAVVGRAGIRKQGNRIVGPDPVPAHLLAPLPDDGRIIQWCLDQVRLHERHAAFGEDQTLRQFLGAHAAVLVEGIAPLRGQALDPRLDRDTAGTPEELDHRRLPQVNPGLHAEHEIARDERLEQRPIGQEDLVDEVEVLHALPDQTRRSRPEAHPACDGGIGCETAPWRRTSSGTGSRGTPRPPRPDRAAGDRTGGGALDAGGSARPARRGEAYPRTPPPAGRH